MESDRAGLPLATNVSRPKPALRAAASVEQEEVAQDGFAADKNIVPLSAEERLLRLEQVFNAAPVGLCLIDLGFKYVMVNHEFAALYQRPVEHFVGRTVEQALPAMASQIIAHLRSCLAAQAVVELELEIVRSSGEQGRDGHLTFLRSARPVHNIAGEIIGCSVALSDITARKRAEAALRESEADYRYTVDLNPHIPWTATPDGTTFYSSPRFFGLTGMTTDQLNMERWRARIHADDRPSVWATWRHSLQTGDAYDATFRILATDGQYRWVRARAFPRRGDAGEIVRWYGTIDDIHEKKLLDEALRIKTTRLEEAMALLGMHAREDHLTGLANRRRLDDALANELARARRSRQPLALLMVDVDHFKRYNDTYGHPAGDKALRTVARILREVLRRKGDLAARYGGEEFVLLLPDTGEQGAMEVARHASERLREASIRNPEGATGFLTMSAGVAIYEGSIEGAPLDQDAANPAAPLIQAADLALYAAKNAGRNSVVSFRSLNGWAEPAASSPHK